MQPLQNSTNLIGSTFFRRKLMCQLAGKKAEKIFPAQNEVDTKNQPCGRCRRVIYWMSLLDELFCTTSSQDNLSLLDMKMVRRKGFRLAVFISKRDLNALGTRLVFVLYVQQKKKIGKLLFLSFTHNLV